MRRRVAQSLQSQLSCCGPCATTSAAPRLNRSYSSTSDASPSTSYATTSAPSQSSSSSRPLPSHGGTRLYNPPPTTTLAHLDSLLSPRGCSLPDEVALRVATHKSAEIARKEGHGEKMAFLGRRVLRMHLSLYLTSALSDSPDATARHLSQDFLDRLLETKQLGATVGAALGLERAMRWREVRGPNGLPTGLFKSRGSVLEAIVGAVYLRHGIAKSSQLFESDILPRMSFPPSLRTALGLSEGSSSGATRSETAEEVDRDEAVVEPVRRRATA